MSYDAWTMVIGLAIVGGITIAFLVFDACVRARNPSRMILPDRVGRPLNDFGQACQAVEELATKLSATVDRMNAILGKAEGMLK